MRRKRLIVTAIATASNYLREIGSFPTLPSHETMRHLLRLPSKDRPADTLAGWMSGYLLYMYLLYIVDSPVVSSRVPASGA